jgi:hypothetical protein
MVKAGRREPSVKHSQGDPGAIGGSCGLVVALPAEGKLFAPKEVRPDKCGAGAQAQAAGSTTHQGEASLAGLRSASGCEASV